MNFTSLKILYDSSVVLLNNKKIIKNEYLDPFSVIITFALNSYKNIGTKISIYENKLYLNESNLFQGSIRKFYGDKKTDVKILYMSILHSCKIYNDELKNSNVRIIYEKAIDGLKKLKMTYKDDFDIIVCLNNYILIITKVLNYSNNLIEEYNDNENNLDNDFDEFNNYINLSYLSKKKKSLDKNYNYSYNDNNDDIFKENLDEYIDKSKYEDVDMTIIKKSIFNKLSTAWNKNCIDIISKLFIELNNEDEDEYKKIIILSIENILEAINFKSKNILQKLLIKY